MTQQLPPSASVAFPAEGEKLHAPSAARNVDHIALILQEHAPNNGSALEIASGTGQHIIAFAAVLPNVTWQPTDLDPDRLRSIDSYVHSAGLTNVRPAQRLDASMAGWSAQHRDQDLIVIVNLLHLISETESRRVLQEAAQALNGNGTMVIYGPFKRNGELTSDGDQRFDRELRETDPRIGYKDTQDINNWLVSTGLTPVVHELPANNLAFVARKPAT
ncbi:DUF938 domain-containing protein [Sulfitobacter sp. F26204]|uniref:DUF938 domain-containing protein n=1 Tax=Sulfitobacter sp. F26204 TaxID=2996014 RepID=UPI00225E634A|nr:DUF938 domain-containing protein [Sulfitobacter sp. F26204]MCX7560961.1 DUF938 domain-containing protein [Sulfitobacter sp. F26204]